METRDEKFSTFFSSRFEDVSDKRRDQKKERMEILHRNQQQAATVRHEEFILSTPLNQYLCSLTKIEGFNIHKMKSREEERDRVG